MVYSYLAGSGYERQNQCKEQDLSYLNCGSIFLWVLQELSHGEKMKMLRRDMAGNRLQNGHKASFAKIAGYEHLQTVHLCYFMSCSESMRAACFLSITCEVTHVNEISCRSSSSVQFLPDLCITTY